MLHTRLKLVSFNEDNMLCSPAHDEELRGVKAILYLKAMTRAQGLAALT